MRLIALLLYGFVILAMVLSCLLSRKGKVYEFPFWAGTLALGWFFPQAVGGYRVSNQFPEGTFSVALLFAALCMASLWAGFEWAKKREIYQDCFLMSPFRVDRLFVAGTLLCICGWYFQWKLHMLPEELTSQGQWSGVSVKYHFLSNIYQIGLICLWLIYLSRRKWMDIRQLIFIVPCFTYLLIIALVHGRRSAMMNLFAYVAMGLWFVRRVVIPRTILIVGVVVGLLVINAIGVYRGIMKDENVLMGERVYELLHADYASVSLDNIREAGDEFKNYIYCIALYKDQHVPFDYGAFHWNELIFNYVPAQIVGRGVKNSLMLDVGISAREANQVLAEKFGFKKSLGTTISGYADAYGSFGWLGIFKFLLIGIIMGTLYRYAMAGSFLGQLLYTYVLGTAMHAISHGTNRILTSVWVYFFLFGYPVLFWARVKTSKIKGAVGVKIG
ncbi:MAG TPA: hypothetical protein VIR63_00670 [Pontiella sp.]